MQCLNLSHVLAIAALLTVSLAVSAFADPVPMAEAQPGPHFAEHKQQFMNRIATRIQKIQSAPPANWTAQRLESLKTLVGCIQGAYNPAAIKNCVAQERAASGLPASRW